MLICHTEVIEQIALSNERRSVRFLKNFHKITYHFACYRQICNGYI